MATKTAPRPRSFFRDDAGERARQAAGEFARNSGKQQRAQVASTEPPPASDEAIRAWMAQRSPAHKAKLKELVYGELKRMGYLLGSREGSALWEKARRKVISNLIAHEVDLDEIDLSGVE